MAEWIWDVVHRERRALADQLEAHPDIDWSTRSLGTDWTVHGVLTHVVHDALTTRWTFLRDLVAAGFDFDRSNERWVAKMRDEPPAVTLRRLREVAGRSTSAPAPLPTRLIEVIVHGEDIRRPLGLRHEYPMEAVEAAIRFQLETGVNLGGGKERADGFRLEASDADLAAGDGPLVRGTALDLLLVLTGRPVPQDVLSGEGAEEFDS